MDKNVHTMKNCLKYVLYGMCWIKQNAINNLHKTNAIQNLKNEMHRIECIKVYMIIIIIGIE